MCVESTQGASTPITLGHVAHIEAWSDDGPRANPSLSLEQRNAYDNLIVLCPNHHKIVDEYENTYTVDVLKSWKRDREASLKGLRTQQMGKITFAELEVITQSLVNNPQPSGDSMDLVPLRQKMERNSLTQRSEVLINAGLLQSSQVRDYVRTVTALDPSFATRLTSRFVNTYLMLRQQRFEGDALFAAVMQFASQGRSCFRYQCAGLAVLVYLFEICEVFER